MQFAAVPAILRSACAASLIKKFRSCHTPLQVLCALEGADEADTESLPQVQGYIVAAG